MLQDVQPRIVAGTGEGGGIVRVLTTEGALITALPFGPSFTGGVRIATGDINGDGATDLVVGTGPGAGLVRVFSGVDAASLLDFAPFGAGFTGGVYVAAGDLNGDGRDDVIVGAGSSGLARVFSGDGVQLAAAYPFGPAYTGGVTVAAGDVNGDGRPDAITGTAFGGFVRVFNGLDYSPLVSGFPYGPLFTGGVSVAAGDFDGDDHADVVTGPLVGSAPVYVFSIAHSRLLADVAPFAGVTGMTVAAGDFDNDGRTDLILGAGPGGAPHVRVYSGADRSVLLDAYAFDASFRGGVFVSAVARGAVGFTSPATATFRVGTANTFVVRTAGGTGITLSADRALPTGLTLTDLGDGTAEISGTPAPGTGGEHALELRATRGGRVAGTQDFTLVIQEPPAFTSASSITFVEQQAGNLVVTSTGFPNATLSVSGALPDGVTFADQGNGTAQLSGTPAVGTAGTYPLTISATNAAGTASQSFTLAVDDVPVASADAYNVNEGATLTVPAPGVIGNDTNVIGGTLTATLVTGPAQAASFSLNPDGSFTYTHNGSETTTDSFTYRASDGGLNSNIATVTIAITPVNDAPVATNDGYTVAEGGTLSPAVGVLANDADPDTIGPLTTVLVSGPSQATAFTFNANGTFTYSHNGSETVSDSFTYQASDGTLLSNIATVTITITPVNDAPAIDLDADDNGGTGGANYAITFTENDPVTLLEDPVDASITDPDSSTLITLTVTLTNLLDTGFELLDVDLTGFPTFAKNYDTTTTPGQGILTIFGAGGPEPVAAFQDLLRRVTYRHSGDNPSATPRMVTFSVFDGTDASNTATSTVTVVSVNDPPTAVDDGYSVNEGGTLTQAAPGVLANDTDPDTPAGSFAVSLVTGPAYASVFALNADGSFIYTHNGIETLTDTFTYKVTDGSADSNTATVTITIAPVNEAPNAIDDVAITDEDTVLIVPAPGVLGNDTDPDLVDTKTVVAVNGDPLLVGVPFLTSKGAVLVNADGLYIYDPTTLGFFDALAAGQSDTDTFTYTMRDTAGLQDTATVTVTINGVNDVPSLDLDADDDGDGVTPPATGNDYATSYTEGDPAVFIEDTVDTTVTDVDSANLSSITVTLTNLLDPTFEILDVDLATGGFDANFTKTYDTTTDPTKGVLRITAVGPQPIADFITALRRVTYLNSDNAPDTTNRLIEFVVNDGAGNSNTATTTVTVVAVDDAPIADDDTFGPVLEGETLNQPAPGVLDGDVDPEGDAPITAVLVSGPANASSFTLSANGSFSYTHNGGETTTDSFTYRASANGLQGNIATVTITITPVNDAPSITAGATITFTEGEAAKVIDNTILVTDPDDTNLESATVQITANYVNGQDILAMPGHTGYRQRLQPAERDPHTDGDRHGRCLSGGATHRHLLQRVEQPVAAGADGHVGRQRRKPDERPGDEHHQRRGRQRPAARRPRDVRSARQH
jgi:large repetitive protein